MYNNTIRKMEEKKPKRIGIFMGSFDPIHVGHIAAIMKVINEKKVDYVVILPCKSNPSKDYEPESLEHRIEMIKCIDVDNYQSIGISEVDTKLKPDPDGKFYSYKSLELAEADINGCGNFDPNPELYIIAGTDVALDIPNWKNSEEILNKYKIINIDRPGYSVYDDVDGLEVSSTEIRKMIKAGKNPIPYVTAEVWHYIKENGLYGLKKPEEEQTDYSVPDSGTTGTI